MPDSNIDESEIDSLADDTVSGSIASRHKALSLDDLLSQPKIKAIPLEREKPNPPANNTVRLDHPLVKLFMEETGLQLLTPEIASKFTDTISVKGEEARETYPSLIRMWDTKDGFSTFATQRIKENTAANQLMNPTNLLKNLRNFGKTDGMIGWLAWKKKHPELCNRVATEPEEVVVNSAPAPADW